MFGKIFSAVAAGLALSSGVAAQREPIPIADLDTEAYLGRWYQISNYPQPYEIICAHCTNAQYTLREDGLVRVENQANILATDGLPCDIEGYAIQDERILGQLTVVFFDRDPGFPNYLVVRLGPIVNGVYSWAITTDPFRSSLYILNRFPLMADSVYKDQLEWLENNGYDTSRLVLTPQAGCIYR